MSAFVTGMKIVRAKPQMCHMSAFVAVVEACHMFAFVSGMKFVRAKPQMCHMSALSVYCMAAATLRARGYREARAPYSMWVREMDSGENQFRCKARLENILEAIL